jgi:hypothetical protein
MTGMILMGVLWILVWRAYRFGKRVGSRVAYGIGRQEERCRTIRFRPMSRK